jgi:arginyl-tRNA synthetase
VAPDDLSCKILGIVLSIADAKSKDVGDLTVDEIVLERPKNRDHGDWATNIGLKLAKSWGQSPRDIALLISE